MLLAPLLGKGTGGGRLGRLAYPFLPKNFRGLARDPPAGPLVVGHDGILSRRHELTRRTDRNYFSTDVPHLQDCDLEVA